MVMAWGSGEIGLVLASTAPADPDGQDAFALSAGEPARPEAGSAARAMS